MGLDLGKLKTLKPKLGWGMKSVFFLRVCSTEEMHDLYNNSSPGLRKKHEKTICELVIKWK